MAVRIEHYKRNHNEQKGVEMYMYKSIRGRTRPWMQKIGLVGAALAFAVTPLAWQPARSSAEANATATTQQDVSGPTGPMPCSSLSQQDFSQNAEAPAVVQSATIVPATATQPEYCDVKGYISPQVKFEVGLPTSGWNGMYYQTGGGGRGGVIPFGSCQDALSRNFAVAAQNMGHDGTDSLWGKLDQQLREDWGHRSDHVTAVVAKQVIKAFYGTSPQHSIIQGCSTGGREALSEVEKYPDDFDGVIAGDPAFAGRLGGIENLFLGQKGLDDNGQPIMTNAKLQLLHAAVLAACDGIHGDVVDGVIRDPRDCHYNPATLKCPGADAPNCLTAAQVKSAQAFYDGPRDKHGKLLFPYIAPYGSELTWISIARQGAQFGETALKNLNLPIGSSIPGSYRDWDLTNANNIKRLEAMAKVYDPVAPNKDPNPKQFAHNGGKMLIYHGGSDAGANFGNSIDYLSEVANQMGGFNKIDSWARLFMVPGMYHCGGGENVDTFDALTAMTNWVTQDIAPDTIVASNPSTGRTRPLVPYPLVAGYTGSGNTEDAANFTAVQPPVHYDGDIKWVWDPKR